MNNVASTYGKNCLIIYGNWSRQEQMKGCQPSPTIGLRKTLSTRLKVGQTSITVQELQEAFANVVSKDSSAPKQRCHPVNKAVDAVGQSSNSTFPLLVDVSEASCDANWH